MVRTYKRKTSRASTAPETMLKAVRQVLVFKKTIRGAAEEFGINYRTLARYCTKIPREEVEGSAEHPSCPVGFIGARQVFSAELEAELVSYVLMASDVYHSLPPKAIRKLAYQLAKGQQLQMPPPWRENKQASADWFSAFMRRHPLLSVRTPEPAGLASAFSTEMFYVKLKALMERHCFKPEDIWVMDETGITTAQRPDRVVARRQAGSSVTCPDRGPLVSVACTVSASGAGIPPYFVFPRVQFRDHFLTGAPTGSSGGAHISGWMRDEQFLHFLQHLVRQTGCSADNPCLLLLDVHVSHLSIDGLNFAKANGVVALSFPPLLERSVCGPFQKCINAAIDSWMLGSPGRSVTIHHIPGIVATALPQAATADNITAGFKACGVFPLRPNASEQQGFVTDCAVAPACSGLDSPRDAPDPSAPADKPSLGWLACSGSDSPRDAPDPSAPADKPSLGWLACSGSDSPRDAPDPSAPADKPSLGWLACSGSDSPRDAPDPSAPADKPSLGWLACSGSDSPRDAPDPSAPADKPSLGWLACSGSDSPRDAPDPSAPADKPSLGWLACD